MVAQHLGGGVGGTPGRPKESRAMPVGMYADETMSEPPASLEHSFGEPPSIFDRSFQYGNNRIFVAVVEDRDHPGARPILLALARHCQAKRDVPYEPVGPRFIREHVATHPTVRQIAVEFRSPISNTEINRLFKRLAGS